MLFINVLGRPTTSIKKFFFYTTFNKRDMKICYLTDFQIILTIDFYAISFDQGIRYHPKWFVVFKTNRTR